jgi:hypothetical protein
MATTRPLSPEDIVARVSQKQMTASGFYDSRLALERTRVTKYLNGELPRRTNEGSSSYVASDVYDSVEMMRAQLQEVFSGGEQIAQFDPDQFMNAANCRVATEAARYVIYRENDGFNIFGSAIYDGLVARAGVVKVFWEEKFKYSDEEFEGISHDDAQALASHDEVDTFDAEEQPDGSFKGTLTRKQDISKVTIVPIAPEEFLIESIATSIDKAVYCGHRTPKTKAELIEMGVDPKLVASLPADDARALMFSPEVLARTSPTRQNDVSDDPIQDELEYIVYFENFVRMQIDPAKGVRLYKICIAGDKLLYPPEEVDKAPFIAYVPLPVSHVFYGNNFAQRVIHTQNARTVLFRGVLDHTAITTNPRWAVVNGGLMNPRELLDNRLGGVVNVRRPDSVQPFQQANLNPYVFNVLGMLNDNNEKSTGISALSQGLDKSAISTQNSKGLVDTMMKVSSIRQKIMARNFAYNFLVPLMLEVVRLLILNHQDEKIIEIAGQPIGFTPKQWTERTSCTVSAHLGYGEKDQAAMDLMQGYEAMAKDPGLGGMFGQKGRFAMLSDIAKLKGFTNFNSYLDPNAPPPGPDPIKMGELQVKQQTAKTAQDALTIKQADASRLFALDQTKSQQQDQQLALAADNQSRTNDRQDADTRARILQGAQQLALEEDKINKDHEAKMKAASRPAASKAA